MEDVSNAIYREVQRIQKMSNASDRSRGLKILGFHAKLLSHVKDLKVDPETFETKIDFRTEKDKSYKFGIDFSGETGLGLYPYLDIYTNDNTLSFDAEIFGLKENSIMALLIVPNLKLLDFSQDFIPGFIFSAIRSNKTIKGQCVKETKFQFSFSKPKMKFNAFSKEIIRKKESPNASPDMLSIPEKYRIIATKLQYVTNNISQDATLGMSISNNGFIQPFYKHEALLEIPIDNLLSTIITAGTIFSRGALPVPERFYDIATSRTRGVDGNEFGISNGSIVCACDCYASAEIFGKFNAEPWTATCFTKAMIGGLTKQASPIEQAGSIFYTFAGIRISRRIFNHTVSLSIFYPISKPDFLKSTKVDFYITD